jgi:hypothetical protein
MWRYVGVRARVCVYVCARLNVQRETPDHGNAPRQIGASQMGQRVGTATAGRHIHRPLSVTSAERAACWEEGCKCTRPPA